MKNFHEVEKSVLGTRMTRQEVLDEYVKEFYPSETDFSNWPPIVPTKEEVVKNCEEIISWLNELTEEDEIYEYSTICDLAGDAGYVAFRDGKQLSAFKVWVS